MYIISLLYHVCISLFLIVVIVVVIIYSSSMTLYLHHLTD